jgi:hypothetical protein
MMVSTATGPIMDRQKVGDLTCMQIPSDESKKAKRTTSSVIIPSYTIKRPTALEETSPPPADTVLELIRLPAQL